MKEDNDDSNNNWDQYLWILALIAIVGFIVWQKWIKPSEVDRNQIAKPHARMHAPQASSKAAKPFEPMINVRNEIVNEVKNDTKDAIPLIERDPGIIERQSERLRKAAEASRNNTERGPRASVLTEKQIQAPEKKRAILQ